MEIVNVRIDDRLIHGQVAMVWSLATGATRMMVVDDRVVKDIINKEALKMACPKQCKLSILNVERAAENLKAGKYQGERVFIVAKSPKTYRDLYDAGFHMEKINVGNMAGGANTKMLKKAVSVTEQDIDDFLYLAEKNVKITAQMVPSDEEIDFSALVRKNSYT